MYRLLPALFEELENSAPISLVRGNGVTMGETESTIFVELPVPGCNKENIEITFEKGHLLVKGNETEEKTDVNYLLKASRQCAFQVAIPRRVDDQSSPEAVFKDGILRVEFKKSRSERPCKIEIKSA